MFFDKNIVKRKKFTKMSDLIKFLISHQTIYTVFAIYTLILKYLIKENQK